MNKFIRYSLLFSSLAILFIVFTALVLTYITYKKGLSVDFLNQNIKNYLSNKTSIANFEYSEGHLRFNDKKNLYLDFGHVEFEDERSNLLFKFKEVQISNLYQLVKKNDIFPKINIDNVKIFNLSNEEILNVDETSINCNANNLEPLFLDSKIRNKCRLISQNIDFIKPLSNQYLKLKPVIDFNPSSIIQGHESDFAIKSEIINRGNQESYYVEGDYIGVKKSLLISKFTGNNLYITEPGTIVVINNNFNKFSLDLNINSKILTFKKMLSADFLNEIEPIFDGFIGWHNVKFIGDIEFNKTLNKLKLSKNININLSGIYDFKKILKDNQFKDQAIYDFKISKKNDNIILDINKFQTNLLSLDSGTNIIFREGFNRADVKFITSLNKNFILDRIKEIISEREFNNNKFINFLIKNLEKNQKLIMDFKINPKAKNVIQSIGDMNISSSSSISANHVFDDNNDPSYIFGTITYKVKIKDILSGEVTYDGKVDLFNTEVYLRQLNLRKKRLEPLTLKFDGNFNNNTDSFFSIQSISSNNLDLKSKFRVSKTNHIFIEDFKVDNNDNVNLSFFGDLSERNLNLNINGKNIDLSKNKVQPHNKNKKYYFNQENYKISTDNALISGGVTVDNLKVSMNKEKGNLSLYSTASSFGHTFNYTREKDELLDVNVISSDDITYFVGQDHVAKKLLSDGSLDFKSVRNLDDMTADINIKLKDFVLINTPASMKLLSLPSISGLVSIAEGESGIRFGYGEISYLESDNSFSNINAYAVSDSLGLVMDGSIDRDKKEIDMLGEISPMHMVNAVIQNLPIIGNIIIGQEGEGMFSIDFSLYGGYSDPEVKSNPLTIIKPRILERAFEILNNS